MKNFALPAVLIFGLCLLAAPASARTIRVLFIGNSYTFVNDLPHMTAQLAHPTTLDVSSVVAGGARLKDLWDGGKALAAIRSQHWDFVVLQGQSQEACWWPAQYVAYARRFIEAVKATGAVPVLYGTWPRRAGDVLYRSGPVRDPGQMLRCLDKGLDEAATPGGVRVARVGDLLFQLLGANPRLPAYSGDGSHLAPTGTFIAAALFVQLLAGHPGTQAHWHPGGVSDADASQILRAATDSIH